MRFCAEPDVAVVVEMMGTLEKDLKRYFRFVEVHGEKMIASVQQREARYGFIDGEHT